MRRTRSGRGVSAGRHHDRFGIRHRRNDRRHEGKPLPAARIAVELTFFNGVVKKGRYPIKALYPTCILYGCAFFFFGFVFGGRSYSRIGLAVAAAAIVITIPIDKAIAKKEKAAR